MESCDSTIALVSEHTGTTEMMITAAAAPTAVNQPKSEATCEIPGEAIADAVEPGEQKTTCADQAQSGNMQKMLQDVFPANEMQNGIGASKNFVSWGVGKVV